MRPATNDVYMEVKTFPVMSGLLYLPFPFQPDEPEWRHVEEHAMIRHVSFIGVLGSRFVYWRGSFGYETIAMSAEAYEVWYEVWDLHRAERGRKTLV